MDANEAALDRLYKDFDAEHLIPLWTQTGELMPMSPTSKALPLGELVNTA